MKKYSFVKSGDVVIDLGAAPGGWMQVSKEIVGDKGFVLGVDVKQIQPIDSPSVQTIIGDVSDQRTIKRIETLLPGPADVVISDISPNVSGVWEVDHARQIDLARQSLRIAVLFLKPKGNFFVKTFQGDMLNVFFKEVKQHFSFVKRIKPRASRAKSAELYILGLNYKTS
jgi:23S rRNA (uridine2552-2'-O)-methyltransferase